MMTEFLNYGDYNVIRVNWFPGVVSTYGEATANSRIVGAEISLLIDRFKVTVLLLISSETIDSVRVTHGSRF